MPEEEIRKEIIADLIINSLYNCLEVESNKITLNTYDLNEKLIVQLLKQYDKLKFETLTESLLDSQED